MCYRRSKMVLKLRRIMAILAIVALSGCAYQVGYEPTYLPDEEPDYISADEVLLVMPEEVENYEYSGGPSQLRFPEYDTDGTVWHNAQGNFLGNS